MPIRAVPDGMRSAAWIAGELALTAAAVLVLFCAYLLWGTGAYTEERQRELQHSLVGDHVLKSRETIRLGAALALIRIPRFGERYHYAIVEGVDTEDLRKGPGHYPGTAMPGEPGNFVISGHRTTYGAPFNRLAELREGDDILIDTRGFRYTYRVTSTRVVDPSDVAAIAAVPGRPGARAARAVITLTTCHPEFSAGERLVVSGVLASVRTHWFRYAQERHV
ncbi:class E sortase [Planotetraspora thailandica]|uniref:class E sortase n=1 Tax=Planotetraspora thailandica TaxID=487172 RepID=UPI001EF202E0|nr:class E sortase [Planotetraspora thailandica]